MNNVIVNFYKGNNFTRSEIFTSVMEADMYIENEYLTYDSYIVEEKEDDSL